MTEIGPGLWTIEVTRFEPSTFDVELKPDGSVSGERRVFGSSQIGLYPQPVSYEIRLSDASNGSDEAGHRFTLRRS